MLSPAAYIFTFDHKVVILKSYRISEYETQANRLYLMATIEED